MAELDKALNLHIVREGSNEFDALYNNDQRLLPIHFFTYKSLKKLLKNESIKVLHSRVFHLYNRISLLSKYINIDEYANKLWFLKQYFGRDILIVGQKEK